MSKQSDALGSERGPSVTLQDVSKVFATKDGPVHALDQIDFEIREHEFCSMVGPSGCGKSTLLLMIAGLLRASHGRIAIAGETVSKPYTELGIVFQQDVLLDWRNTLDNVLVQCEIRGLPLKDYKKHAMELLDMVGLKGFERKYPAQLSGGMRQRASICRALVHDPPLLLMDEPFGALDALTREQMNFDLLKIWEQNRKTVLFITHSISEAVLLSDRVLVLSPRPGRIEAIIDIALPRPRDPATRKDHKFVEYMNEIEEVFRTVGVLA